MICWARWPSTQTLDALDFQPLYVMWERGTPRPFRRNDLKNRAMTKILNVLYLLNYLPRCAIRTVVERAYAHRLERCEVWPLPCSRRVFVA